MSALRERQPINVTGCEASLGDNKSKIIALEERKKNLYNEVKAMGFLKEPYFTANQLNILELRGYPREGPLIP